MVRSSDITDAGQMNDEQTREYSVEHEICNYSGECWTYCWLLCCLGCEAKITAETETKSQNEAEGISCPSSVERVREVASCCLLRLPHPGSPSPATTVSVSLLAVGRQQCHLRLPGFEVLQHLAASWAFSDWRRCKTDLNLFRCGKFPPRISQGKADSLSLIFKTLWIFVDCRGQPDKRLIWYFVLIPIIS